MRKIYRSIALIALAIASVLVLLAGIGTACVAIAPTAYGPRMALLAGAQWQFLVVTLADSALGLFGLGSALALLRGRPGAAREGLVALVLMLLVGWGRMALSRGLRGTSMPYDLIQYVVVAALALFLLFLWKDLVFGDARIGVDGKAGGKKAGGLAAMVVGLLLVLAPNLFGGSHTFGGVNYAEAFNAWLMPIGWAILLGGAVYVGSGFGVSRWMNQKNAAAIVASSRDVQG